MKNYELEAIVFNEFYQKLRVQTLGKQIDYKAYFKPYIMMAKAFSLGPHFWFIPDNITMNIVAVSENVEEQTGYTEAEWTIPGNFNFFPSLIHPDDRGYVLAALEQMKITIENFSAQELSSNKIFIYCRFLNAKRSYRWTVFQFPAFLFTESREALSALILISDISHLNILNAPLMTVILNNKNVKNYYKIDYAMNFDIPTFKITKREREIIMLMANGLNTPQIAKHLFLSYSTIENHKRNLRKKTGAKTSVEMMNIVNSCNQL